MDPPIHAAWDNDDCESDEGDQDNNYISSIDAKIDFEERYEAVGCIGFYIFMYHSLVVQPKYK